MKIRHTIHGLSTVSFTSTPQKNPSNGELTGVVLDNWEEIQHSAAMGLEELQNRIERIEKLLSQTHAEEKIVALLEQVDTIAKKQQKPPKEPPPPGVPLSHVRRGPKKGKAKAEVKP